MALKFYKAYLNTTSKEPNEYWRELRQAAVDDTWFDTSTVSRVEGQTSVGKKTYACESVQLNSVLDPKTGSSLGDNFRKIIYRNLAEAEITEDTTKTKRFLGKYYKFDNYTWLTINTNTNVGAIATAIVEKCNNTLKWYDANGVFHIYPCVFERSLSSTGFDYGSKGVAEVSATSLIKVQRNAETETIQYNQRFLFDERAFQVKQINNHISSTYMELYIFEIQIQANDDLKNNIANTENEISPTTTETILSPDINKILQGRTQEFSIYKYINGVESTDTYNIEVTGAVSNVNYILNIIDGNRFTIQNKLQSNEPLVITCTNITDEEDIVVKEIVLGGVW